MLKINTKKDLIDIYNINENKIHTIYLGIDNNLDKRNSDDTKIVNKNIKTRSKVDIASTKPGHISAERLVLLLDLINTLTPNNYFLFFSTAADIVFANNLISDLNSETSCLLA